MNKCLFVFLFLLIGFYSSRALSNDVTDTNKIVVGAFSSNNLVGWEKEVFSQETSYVLTEINNETVLKSISANSASGLVKKITVDVKKYPYLNWRWRVESRFPSMDETKRSGDDYTARIYVVVSGGLFFWRTKALNFVWSSRKEKDVVWPNAFSPSNIRMVAVRSSEDKVGTWYTEKQNVYTALQQWIGGDVNIIDAVAIMTDTDNTGGQTTAYYGDIYFSKE